MLNATFEGTFDPDCLETYKGQLEARLSELIEPPCDPFSDKFNFSVHATLHIEGNQVRLQSFI